MWIITWAIIIFALGHPIATYAHEQMGLNIGGKDYFLVVGFEEEPIFIGEKATVSLLVGTVSPQTAAATSSLISYFGLPKDFEYLRADYRDPNNTLQLEIGFGGEAHIFELLKPLYPLRLAFQTNFFPTAPGPYSFRFFGKINGIPVEFETRCISDVSLREVGVRRPFRRVTEELSPGVIKHYSAGGFPCPLPRSVAQVPGTGAGGEVPAGGWPGGILRLVSQRNLYLGLGGIAALLALAGIVIGIRALIRRVRGPVVPPY